MQTTVGQVLVNAVLPADLRDYSRVVDKKSVKDIMEALAAKGDPELFKRVLHSLQKIGQESAQYTGGSFSIRDMVVPPKTKARMAALRKHVVDIVNRDDIDDARRSELIKKTVMDSVSDIESGMMSELLAANNPFALQVKSGSRGGPADLRSMLLGDMLVTDAEDKIISMPILNGYATGLDPVEYWAGSYGARKGTISTKMSTADAGFLAKQLVGAAHRSVVTSPDCETQRGVPVRADDSDNIGTVLAVPAGGFAAGTVIDSRVQRELGDLDIVVRSPLTCGAHSGVCSKCVGIRERGGFPEIGDNVGVAAAQAIGEKLSQLALNVKHSGGRARTDIKENELTGFPLVNQLAQVPKAFRGAATIAHTAGVVESVREAPQGGKYIVINRQEHYVPRELDVSVKPGDRVDAGDVLTDGIPNPAEIVEYKGVGAGRLAFVDIFRNAFRRSNIGINRRNIELLTRGLINHVDVTDLDGVDNAMPGDVVEYNDLERNYKPRYGHRELPTGSAANKYLERPYLHYTVGTPVTKSVIDSLKKHGVKSVDVHDDPPPFRPRMIRAMETLSHAPDWQVRLGGWWLERGMLSALHRGTPSEVSSTSYIPGLARGKDFGAELKTKGVY